MKSKASAFLDILNKEYSKLHKTYEDLFWVSYMGDPSVDKKKDEALAKRDTFRANPKFVKKIHELREHADTEERVRLDYWLRFFECYQCPKEALSIKNKISKLESVIIKKRGSRKEGYIDPYTKKFTKASSVKMSTMISTDPDERIRKACFEAKEKLALDYVDEYIEVVALRNKYARILGYEDFYDYKVQREDGMTKDELFSIFDHIYEKTKYAKDDIKEMEKNIPGLRKPWNFHYMTSGDFTKEEDVYFKFEDALIRWGKSFDALGIDFRGSTLQLDLLDRKGKWNNGFCHWPDLVSFDSKGKRKPGSSNFTCTVVMGQVGSGMSGFNTLFHEGGHAAHLLNVETKDVCINHEYAPQSMSWAETHSMFMDTMLSSIEWRTRYAKYIDGKSYPFDLYERKMRKLHLLRPLGLNGVMFVSNFEREIYECKTLTIKTVKTIAKKMYRKYYERSSDSVYALSVPHIYSWESSASYHGYGLAQLAVDQWREYFYEKNGFIVDNPKVGKEMAKVWALGASKTFSDFVIYATGEKLSADAFLKNVTTPLDVLLDKARAKIARLKKVRPHVGKVELNAKIKMVSGNKVIATNYKSFEDMAEKYKKWLKHVD